MRIIAGALKNRQIKSPKGTVTRPTTERLREAVFNICQSDIEGARFLDLFAGSGAMGIEAISRGAKEATFLDQDRESIRCIKENLKSLGIENKAKVLNGDFLKLLDYMGRHHEQFEVIYADPPYRAENQLASGDRISYSLQLLMLLDQLPLLTPGGYFFLEDASDLAFIDPPLQKLMFVNTRRIGTSMLRQYRY